TETGEADPRAAHAPPLPGPPLWLRGVLPDVGCGVPDAAAPQKADPALELGHPTGRIPPIQHRDHVVGDDARHAVACRNGRGADVRQQHAAWCLEQARRDMWLVLVDV